MQTDQGNYGMVESQDGKTVSVQDERTWSIFAHLTMFLNLVIGFLGPVAALVI